MTNYIPLLTASVAVVFSILLFRQYLERRKVHQLVWTLGMVLYGLTALIEYLANPDVIGPNVLLIKIYYVSAAPLVGLLGAGVLYLLAPRRLSNYFLAFVIALSLILVASGFASSLDQAAINVAFQSGLPQGFSDTSMAFPSMVRAIAVILNSVGGTLLIGGALYSFIRDRTRSYNILIALGGILPSIGGFLLGITGNADVFFEFELGGTVLLFLGFLLSMRYIARR